MTTKITKLRDRHAVTSFDKQLHLADVVGSLGWNLSLKEGVLSFGDRYRWRIQVLGSESHVDHTWLWAWENKASHIPLDLLEASLKLRDLGNEMSIQELTQPHFNVGEIDGHALALIASDICKANAYYRAPYDVGAAFLLIMDDSFPQPMVENPIARIASVFPQAISALEISDHKHAFSNYLCHYGLSGSEASNQIVVEDKGENVMTASFDDLNRLTKLEAKIAPAATPTAKSDEEKKEEVAKALAELWKTLKTAAKDFLKSQQWPDLRPHLDKALENAEPEGVANARQFLEQSVTWFPWAAQPRRLLAHLLIQHSADLAGAEKVAHELLELDPNDAVAKEQLAVVQERQGISAPTAEGPAV